MAQAKTATATESVMDNAKQMGEDLTQAGKNALYAGLGVVAFTEEKARETFDRMVDMGKTFEKDQDKILSRATREAKELGQQLEQRAQKAVTTTLNRAGVPTSDEIHHLTERVEALTRKVDDLVSK